MCLSVVYHNLENEQPQLKASTKKERNKVTNIQKEEKRFEADNQFSQIRILFSTLIQLTQKGEMKSFLIRGV